MYKNFPRQIFGFGLIEKIFIYACKYNYAHKKFVFNTYIVRKQVVNEEVFMENIDFERPVNKN